MNGKFHLFVLKVCRGIAPRSSLWSIFSAQPLRRAAVLLVLFSASVVPVHANVSQAPQVSERLFEWTFRSTKAYADPFNDVDVDVVFTSGKQSWRVPAFWRGEQLWTVRFAPPSTGTYAYRVESTDPRNAELNGLKGRVKITAYTGPNGLLRHGPLRISANRRYFEHADGTPFYWLGDTWWTGLSDRLSWPGFQTLTADRQAKGFTLVQIVAGLVPYEEIGPLDPGFQNEGGPVWEAEFARINPSYFDYADRRIMHLLDAGIVPAIVGGWRDVIRSMGVQRMKQHWRYVIARYGAYPVFWVVGGEALDPPEEAIKQIPAKFRRVIPTGWTEVAQYVRATDPYHHPMTAHENAPPLDLPLRDSSVEDFELIQSGHLSWSSIALEVAQINMHYARSAPRKPVVQGEIGYEKLGENHFEDFQRTAFWLSMLNGAAGHTYGANGTWESYSADKPLHRVRHSFVSWEEGMSLPGSYQVGLGAKLLRRYPWWKFEPHPEWVVPRGTTLLEPHEQANGSGLGLERFESNPDDFIDSLGTDYPGGQWKAHNGNFRRPYAAGIPGEVRVIYIPPKAGMNRPTAPTVLALESGVRYDAYWWEPSYGTRIELGEVMRPVPGAVSFSDEFSETQSGAWRDQGTAKAVQERGALVARDGVLAVVDPVKEIDVVVAATLARPESAGALVLRYANKDNYLAAVFSPADKSLWLTERKDGVEGAPLGKIPVDDTTGGPLRLSAEVRGTKAAASITVGRQTFTTPIVDLAGEEPGNVGVLLPEAGPSEAGKEQHFDNFEVRRSVPVSDDELIPVPQQIYDARGTYRGDLLGPGVTSGFTRVGSRESPSRKKHILLDAYRPDRLPTSGDWILVLESGRDTRQSRR